jgi:SAM-dependent methyltransferase
MKKKIIILILDLINLFWTLIPKFIRKFIFRGLFAIESRGNSKSSLKFLFSIDEYLEQFISQSAIRYEGKHHPKHRLTNYHNYFIDNIEENSKVLDVGCGYGYVASKIAEKKLNAHITGVDRVIEKINFAKHEYKLPNLNFICANVIDSKFSKRYDAIILSNIIEHIDKRVDFLKLLIINCKPKKILFRVPDFKRSWYLPLKKELGINYFSDAEHFIEPTYEEFEEELNSAGLKILDSKIIWGEIWSVCEVKSH